MTLHISSASVIKSLPRSWRSPVSDQLRGVRHLFAIENLEWGFARARLKAVVVRELSIWKTILPLHAERDDTSPEHIFKNLVDTLDLSTSLRMESCAEANVCAHGLLKRIPKLGGKDAATV